MHGAVTRVQMAVVSAGALPGCRAARVFVQFADAAAAAAAVRPAALHPVPRVRPLTRRCATGRSAGWPLLRRPPRALRRVSGRALRRRRLGGVTPARRISPRRCGSIWAAMRARNYIFAMRGNAASRGAWDRGCAS